MENVTALLNDLGAQAPIRKPELESEQIGAVLAALFPHGVTLRTAEDFDRWAKFEKFLGKVTCFARRGLVCRQSVNDAAILAAILQASTRETTSPIEVRAYDV